MKGSRHNGDNGKLPYQYLYRKGRQDIQEAAVAFRDNDHILQVIDKIVSPLGELGIDESSPMVDARLPDGSRVNAVIPLYRCTGPCITIRKFSKEPYGIDDLVSFRLSAEMAQFLRACVQARINGHSGFRRNRQEDHYP